MNKNKSIEATATPAITHVMIIWVRPDGEPFCLGVGAALLADDVVGDGADGLMELDEDIPRLCTDRERR